MMRFKKNDNSVYNLRVVEATQEIDINYKLVKLSNANYTAIDRGPSTDRYASTFTIEGKTDYINDLVQELTLLRNAGKDVIIDQFEEPVFGDDVDHSIAIACVVEKLAEQKTPVLNKQIIMITFLTTDLSFIGTPSIPILNCLQHNWEGYGEWNAHVNETYNRSNFFVDNEADTYVFEGTYSLSFEDNKSLLSFQKHQRGDDFIINEADWDVEQMFGGFITDGQHTVKLLEINYSRISPVRRDATIKLVKVG